MAEKCIDICKGNPGALSVISEIIKKDHTKLDNIVQKLIDNNIEGSDIWIIYKKKCNHDIDVFLSYPFETYVSQNNEVNPVQYNSIIYK